MSDVHERPLFRIRNCVDKGEVEEGAYKEKEMLYGTYLHGIFDKKPFRSFFLSHVVHDGERFDTSNVLDYDDVLEDNIERLADVFEDNMDIDALMGILEGTQ